MRRGGCGVGGDGLERGGGDDDGARPTSSYEKVPLSLGQGGRVEEDVLLGSGQMLRGRAR